MSLINDALKKAQKQRTGDTPPLASMPSIGGEPAARIAKRAKPAGFNALLIRGGLIGGAVLVLLVGGYFVMRGSNRTPAVAPVAAPVTARSSPLPAAGAADLGSIPASPKPAPSAPATTPAVSFTLPIATPATVAPATPPSAPETKPVAPVAAAPIPVVAKPAAPVGKLDGKAINYIEALRIAGIRASATDSKVLMNDRVYRVGDIVEHEMGLKLVGITSSSLTFENEAGARYTRNF